MEQHKLETQFKEQLNSREIKPSEKAWEKLDAMLTEAEEKKPKHSYNWIYIAASIIGFAFLGTFYFSRTEITIENQKNEVVIQHPILPKTDAMPYKPIDFKTQKEASAANAFQQSVSKKDKSSELKQESAVVQNNLNKNQGAELSIINQNTEQESISSQTKDLTVDELLARVDKSARLNNKTNPNLEVYVNANQLLLQVDSDLEPAFRQSVFGKVADNLKVIKEAVVNRNKE